MSNSRAYAKKWLNARTMVVLAMLAAVAYVVMWLSKFIPSVIGILDFDFKDVVICIGGFVLGPAAAIILSILVPVIEFFTVSGTGPIGLVMNVLATASFCCTACYIYKKHHTQKGAVIGLGTGVVVLVGVMLLWNYLITPIYQEVPRAVVAEMLLPIFLPFNLAKGGMNMAATLLLYKPVVTALRKANLVTPSQTGSVRTFSGGFVLFALALLATFVLLALVLLKII